MYISINNALAEIPKVHDSFTEHVTISIRDPSVIAKMCIVIDEVLSNIINHGFNDESIHKIIVDFSIESNLLILCFQDDGNTFNPLLNPEKEMTQELEFREEGGLGIPLMKNLVDDIKYERKGLNNILTIKKSF